VFNKTVKI